MKGGKEWSSFRSRERQQVQLYGKEGQTEISSLRTSLHGGLRWPDVLCLNYFDVYFRWSSRWGSHNTHQIYITPTLLVAAAERILCLGRFNSSQSLKSMWTIYLAGKWT
jgi:hypothetical protein